jgi:hypothetical protein
MAADAWASNQRNCPVWWCAGVRANPVWPLKPRQPEEKTDIVSPLPMQYGSSFCQSLFLGIQQGQQQGIVFSFMGEKA